ncbi:T9SS type B sorting domain-containing protein [Croceitalea marina]|uniref:T9SS type B sorting domain-containing protein n=1 Tax=Croceitalea marina TaxID=1775166 RepID=A0ABW5MU29_9FLAO
MPKRYALFILLISIGGLLNAQVSSDCSSAVPICSNTPANGGANGFGLDDFNGATRSGCLEATTTGAIESNSSWYRFRTSASGQLGFNIGHDASEDWDFALYLADNCNDLGEPIRCNFFDNRDENQFIGVGEDPTGNTASLQYEDWVNVEPGQNYYLLINNFSSSDSGFSIQFTGDIFNTNPTDALDCSIISNLLGAPIVACENETVQLDATTSNAVSYRWYRDFGSGFQLIQNQSNSTLTINIAALYRVEVITSAETIISDVQVAFSSRPVAGPLVHEVVCVSADVPYDLGQKDMEALNGQDANSFLVGYYSSLADAQMGINELPKKYEKTTGVETIFVRVSSLENPNCYDASQSFEFEGIAAPILDLDQQLFLCEDGSTATIGQATSNPNYAYSWNTGQTTPSITVSEPGTYILTATTSQGNVNCVRTRTIEVITSISPEISAFEIDGFSISNTVTILTELDGDFEFRLDDGEFQTEPIFEDVLPGNHTVFMRDLNGCGVVTEEIAVVGYFAYFSPNGDGINDSWRIEGMEYLNEPVISIYNRYGKLIKQLNANDPGWDGTFSGQQMPESDYWFKLSYLDDNGTRLVDKFLQKNFSLRR